MTCGRARRQLALAAPDAGHDAAAGEVDGLERIEAGALQPALHLVVGEAEMDMGVLALQFDQIVRREIDDQHHAAGPHHAGGLAQRRGRIVGIVQDVMDGDDVEAVGFEGQGIHVALADVGIVDAGPGEVVPRQRQHLARLVDADGLLDLGRQHFQKPAGAGADVEQPARADRQVMGQRALDLAVGDVQGPQFVPALGIVAEEAHRGGLPTLLQGVEPGAVGGDPAVLGIDPPHELSHKGCIVAGRHQAKARELRLAKALEQSRFDQKLEMARHARLALPQHVHIVADGQIFARRQRQDSQPRVFGGGSQEDEEVIHVPKDISISLCMQGAVGG